MTGWHVETAMLERYAARTIDETSAMSVEAHVLACRDCRAAVTGLVQVGRLERVWDGVAGRVDAPERGAVERLLAAAGVPEHVARLLAATPSLTLSWLSAAAIALGFAALAAQQGDRGVLLFLAVAPLVPLAGIAAAYGPSLDPAYEIGLASPFRSFGLLLLRSVAVLTTSVVLAALVSLALPVADWRLAAWLLPALALATGSLALASWLPPLRACAALALGWIVLVTVTGAAAADRFAAFRVPAQLAFLAATLLAAAVVAARRDVFERRDLS